MKIAFCVNHLYLPFCLRVKRAPRGVFGGGGLGWPSAATGRMIIRYEILRMGDAIFALGDVIKTHGFSFAALTVSSLALIKINSFTFCEINSFTFLPLFL